MITQFSTRGVGRGLRRAASADWGSAKPMAKSQSNETDRNGRTRTPQGVALYREALVRQVESVQEAGVCPPRPPEILRLRVAGETEKRRAIVLTYISGLANSAFAMAMSLSEVAEGLPPIRPRLRGARNSSIVRSRITPRPNSASAPKLRNMSLSSGVAVSMVPVSERKPTPRFSRLWTVAINSASERESRSSRHTTLVSPARANSSAASNYVLCALPPDTISSNTFAHPAAERASRCSAMSCSSVLTQLYPINISLETHLHELHVRRGFRERVLRRLGIRNWWDAEGVAKTFVFEKSDVGGARAFVKKRLGQTPMLALIVQFVQPNWGIPD